MISILVIIGLGTYLFIAWIWGFIVYMGTDDTPIFGRILHGFFRFLFVLAMALFWPLVGVYVLFNLIGHYLGLKE